jgi:ATP-binding cassette subfamily B multidrug efflux pump
MLRLLKYLKGWAIVCAFIAPVMMFIEVAMDLMQPKLMADIIDIGVASGNTPYIFAVGGKMIFVALIGLIGGVGCTVFAVSAAFNMGEKLRQGVFDKVQNFSFLELDKFKTSSLITRLTNDVTQVQNMLLMALRIMVRAPLICVGGLIMAFALSPKLSLVFLVVVPIILVAVILILKKSFPVFSSVQEKIDRINLVMRENILGVRVIKSCTLENIQESRFDEANNDLMDKSVKAQNINMLLWPVVTLTMNLSVIAVLWFGGNMANKGMIEIGKVMAFINYLLQIMNSLMMVVMLVLNFSRAKASADRINEVLGSTASVENNTNPVKMEGFDIEFKEVSFKYNEHGEEVLKDISFKAKEREKIGIIGATGSGKSSLASLIPRLYDVTQGEILIGGVNVKELQLNELRDNVGVVLQDSILFSGTIEDNLKFGNEYADLELMESAARASQAYEFITAKENTYKSIVEQRGKNLSGGQKQRLSIARTLVRNPKILIMDDSSSALDMATEARLKNSINNRMVDSTVLIIAQRISGVMDADKIIVLDNGRISAIGTHMELLKQNEIYRSIAVSQLGKEVLSIV